MLVPSESEYREAVWVLGAAGVIFVQLNCALSPHNATQVWNREDGPVDSAYPADYYTSRLFPFWILVSETPFSVGAGKIGCVILPLM